LRHKQNLAAETAAYLTTKHPDYAILAARIAISNLHKETKKVFSEVVADLYSWGECVGCGGGGGAGERALSQDGKVTRNADEVCVLREGFSQSKDWKGGADDLKGDV
jgi:hypothetical protein